MGIVSRKKSLEIPSWQYFGKKNDLVLKIFMNAYLQHHYNQYSENLVQYIIRSIYSNPNNQLQYQIKIRLAGC